MSDYRDEFRQVQSEFYWTLPRLLIGALVVCLLFGMGFWVLSVASQPGRVIAKTFDADNIISNYEWYRDAWGNIQSKKSQIGQFKGMLKGESDKAEANRLRIELAAIQQSCRDLANRYNANASKMNRNIFMGTTVPNSVDTGGCE